MRFIAIVATVALCGCATENNDTVTAEMRALNRKPISEIIDRLGYPSRYTTVMNDKVYVWETKGCTLTIGVDSGDEVVHAEYDGGHRDCAPYQKKLEFK